ncbi:MAG: zinc ABC transporter substrate-binding protein [Chlorogloeopsis fritschii C42_A2020_084]|jgi:manganese/iron transport system substrate-binding protein|uniref:metal ABC transporter solute-binding protein, Zn/Mn family n=1 Tax=Chlorogloeopsis fritschii TaxID=1124 RepID=UPI0019FC21B0|nr:zinc ABC transporter substrate-binding protein [Chlorogloeopsis fritschii]MBF2006134.1 zinc ABC transporter substrate-binding protein [Chlorogloeopsis fritschii C42_A2020_084]
MYTTSHRIWRAITLVITFGLLSACAQSPPTSETSSLNSTASPAANGKLLKVVATTTILCDITRQIAANTVDLRCLLKPGVDGHTYQPVPEDRKAIEDANLIFYSGHNFEPELIKLIKATSNPAPKVAVAEEAVPNPQQFEEDGQTEDDPHVWQNAENGARMVEVVETHLAKLLPANTELYAKNAKALSTELLQIHSWIKSQIATIPQSSRKLVTTHDAFGYYTSAYNIPVEGALQGVSTEEKPTAARVKKLVDSVKNSQVPTIFAEVTVNPKLLETVAKEANVKISDRELYSDSLGEPGSDGDTYPKMLIANTKTIVEGLGGQFTAFQGK